MLRNIPLYLIFPLFLLYNTGLLLEIFEFIYIGYYSLVYPIVALLLLFHFFNKKIHTLSN